ncbi:MAG: tetratricopeptide repeat protein [Bacteroidales bacterium]|nr:tetratricopeptide repeat protein [Bacteroidales bacterium]
MRKNILFLIFTFVLFHYSNNDLFSQKSRTDSLYIELQKAKEDTNKVNILIDFSLELQHSYPDSSIYYVEKGLSLAKKLNYKKREAYLFNNLGNINRNLGHYDRAISSYQNAIEIFTELTKSPNVYLNSIGKRGIANSYKGLGAVAYMQGNYNIAINYYQKAIRIFEELDNMNGMASCYNNIGMVHWKQDNYDRAIEYYKKALVINEKNDRKIGMAACYNNIAIIYKSLRKYKLAINHYQKSLAICEELGHQKGIAVCFNNIGKLYEEQKKYSSALNYYQRALNLRRQIGDKNGIASSLGSLADLNITLAELSDNNEEKYEKYVKAFNHATEDLKIAKKIGALFLEMEAYNFISESLAGLRKFEESLNYYKLHVELKDSLFNKERNEQIEEMEVKYQTEKKQLEIGNLEKENLLKAVKLEKMQIRQILSYGIIFVSVFIIILLIIIRNKLRKKNSTIFEQNETITIQYQEILSQNEEILTQKEELEKHQNHLEKLVTERTKELEIAKEKAEESDRLKTAFLANMSHEIRTPMNAIIGFTDLLNDSELTDETKVELTGLINHNSDTLLHLIDDIIDLSKIESGQLKIDKRECNIDKIFNLLFEIFNERKNILSKSKINIIVNNKLKNEQFKLVTDHIRLQQILSNLIDNALKFTEKGFVEYGCFFSDKNDQELTFYVKDTGIGLSPDQQVQIFNRFYKTEEDKRKLYRGAGLGLSISKKLTELLGGKLWVESEKDMGSVFYFTLPFTKLAKNEVK